MEKQPGFPGLANGMGEDADHAHPDTSSAAVQKVYQMLGTHMASGILTLRPLHLPLPRTDQRLAERASTRTLPPSGPGRGGCDTTGQPRLGEAKHRAGAVGGTQTRPTAP